MSCIVAFLHDIYRIIYEKIRETCSNKIYLTCISRETRVGHFETRVVFRDGYKRFTRVSGFFDERTGEGLLFRWSYGVRAAYARALQLS